MILFVESSNFIFLNGNINDLYTADPISANFLFSILPPAVKQSIFPDNCKIPQNIVYSISPSNSTKENNETLP